MCGPQRLCIYIAQCVEAWLAGPLGLVRLDSRDLDTIEAAYATRVGDLLPPPMKEDGFFKVYPRPVSWGDTLSLSRRGSKGH